jgi:Leucine-rich repeat (LRR) protein
MKANVFDVFEGSLKRLFITTDSTEVNAYSNQIEKIDCAGDALQVTVLVLSNNSISTLNCISQMPMLLSLYMPKNKLKQLRQSDFAKLVELRFLYLTENPIIQVVPKVFLPLKKMKEFQVNSLKNYKNLRVIFPNIESLTLNTRKWNCSRINQVANLLNRQKIYIYFDILETSLCQREKYEFWNFTSD